MRLLIADSSALVARLLAERLEDEMEVRVCGDGCQALELLQSFQPDALILDLQLPMKDGLTVLRQSAYVPPVVLAVAALSSLYVQRTAYALGVSQLMVMPSLNTLAVSLTDLIQWANDPDRKPDLREQARLHLHNLNVHPKLAGYRMLAVGLPLFFADPHQQMTKGLYPAIQEALGLRSWRSVERAMRTAIANASKHRDPAVWARYFPNQTECPNNTQFLTQVIKHMKE